MFYAKREKKVAGRGSLRGTAACTYESIKEINGQLGCRLGKQASRAAGEQELGQCCCRCTYRAVRTKSTETDLGRMNLDSNFDSESENRFLKKLLRSENLTSSWKHGNAKLRTENCFARLGLTWQEAVAWSVKAGPSFLLTRRLPMLGPS